MSINPQLSRLGLLMNSLNIAGKELAKALHLDASLVSKWKNNHRPLTSDSPYLRDLAQYLLNQATEQKSNIISVILNCNYHQDTLEDEEAILTELCHWLTGQFVFDAATADLGHELVPGDIFYKARFGVWQANRGRRQAVRRFLRQVLALTEPCELLLVSQEPLDWLTENKAFLAEWQELLHELLIQGNKIQIVHSVDRSLGSLTSILEHWLPLYLTGGVRSWFYPVYGTLPYYLTLFIVKDKMVLSSLTPYQRAALVCTTLSQDPLSLQQYTGVFYGLVEQCEELIYTYSDASLLKALCEISSTALQSSNEIYTFSQTPLFTTMSEDLLIDILQTNQVTPAVQKQLLTCYNAQMELAPKVHRHLAMPLSRIAEYLFPGSKSSLELSRLAGQEVVLTQEQRIQHIQHLITELNNDSCFELGFIKDKEILSVLIADQQAVLAWSSSPDLPAAALAREPTIVRAFYEHFRLVWEAVPRIYRTKALVIETLEDQLRLCTN